MSDYFQVSGGTIIAGPIPKQRLRHPTTSISASTTDAELKILGFLPQVKVGDDPYDQATQEKTGPVNVVGANEVTSTWTIRNKTAQEIDDEKTMEATRLADLDYIKAAIIGIATAQENKGSFVTTADLAAIRTAAINWLKSQ